MAELLAQSREASARIRVENIIHTDVTIELMEILELYAELLLARAGLLDLRDKNIKDGISTHAEETGLEEAAASLIYASTRLPRDVRELVLVRNLLAERFGKEFTAKAAENRDDVVPKRVADKLKVGPPPEKLVQGYLEAIAQTYGVDWPRPREVEGVEDLEQEIIDEDEAAADAAGDDDNNNNTGEVGGGSGGGGGQKEVPPLPAFTDNAPSTSSTIPSNSNPSTPTPKPPRNLTLGSLASATPPRGPNSLQPGGAKSPVSIAPPGPSSDNPRPTVKVPAAAKPSVPGLGVQRVGGGAAAATAAGGAGGVGSVGAGAGAVPGKVPTVDDLAKRFSALKR